MISVFNTNPVPIGLNEAKNNVALNPPKSGQNLVPINRQSITGIDAPQALIYHPKQAPSAVTSENFLNARAMLSAGFTHNIAQTKIARISNLYRDAPRFRNDVDILA
ncbi:hypothetical protein N9D03_07570 [Alphaproteobacteria bacterium]|jgi:hypothetical protein|nr:hypothetical protein [Alphaproteobacteria bacterium]MDB2497732.1 hypothetical protein [Alphaproteobacteria bacterium]